MMRNVQDMDYTDGGDGDYQCRNELFLLVMCTGPGGASAAERAGHGLR